ncbi:MAG TPA: DUF3313 domain-containing protein [Geobacteraceae bacterium]|nr:DUF3313 domain-containing protein [Geobacteraceae bacterium]
MGKMKGTGLLVMAFAAAALLGGCAGSYQARNVDMGNSPLVNPSVFTEGTGDQALYRYVKPGVDVKQYDKVLIDPVLVMKDGELDASERENYQALANNAFVYLKEALEKDYKVVQAPEAGTFRVQMAIIDADSSKPVRNTLSTLSPIGIGLNIVKYSATGKQSGVGEITMEMKVTDAVSGDLLGAALDRRVGGKTLTKLWSSWYNADEALKYWAQRFAFVLCENRGGMNCVKPD